jgi:hypothetical protein
MGLGAVARRDAHRPPRALRPSGSARRPSRRRLCAPSNPVTLKKEATRPPGLNCLQQQDRIDAFAHEFNVERPHEALSMKCLAELYVASPRRYGGLPELTYPFHDGDIRPDR